MTSLQKSAAARFFANLVLGASPAFAALAIYEPFADSESSLTGNSSGSGLTGNWSGSGDFQVLSGSLSYGALITSGNRVTKPGGGYDNIGADASILSTSGRLDDGETLWFSALMVADDGGGTRRSYLTIGTGNPDGFDRVGGGSGSGVGVKIDGTTATAHGWSGGARRGSNAAVSEGPVLVVGRMTWAASGSDDSIDIFLPGTDLSAPAPTDVGDSRLFFDFDQSGFTTLGFAGGNSGTEPDIDEIRFGDSFADVVPIPEPSSSALLAGASLLLMARRRKAC